MTRAAAPLSGGQGDGKTGLEALLDPGSVAVIGASDSPQRIGGRVVAHLKRSFDGEIVPVNPGREAVQGLPAFSSIGAVPAAPDLAIAVVPADQVPDVARACATRGVRALIVFSSGFAEVGGHGAALQDALADIRRDSGMRILGPNSMGLVNLRRGLRATFAALTGYPIEPGNVAAISQSGAFGLRVFEGAQTEGLGVSYLCLTGNECDVTAGELVGYLVEQDDVAVVTLFLEGVRSPELLLASGRRAAELGKPVVVLKAAVTSAGGRAAASHTGSLVVGQAAFEAAMESAGMITVSSLRQLLSHAKAMSVRRPAGGRRVCVLTGSGGAGILMSDHLTAAGLELPEPSPALRAQVGELVPPFGSAGNPIDYTGQILNDTRTLPRLLSLAAGSPEYDMICLTGISRAQPPEVLSAITDLAARSVKPFLVWTPQLGVAVELSRAGAAAITDAEALAGSAAALAAYDRLRAHALEDRPGPTRPPLLAAGDGDLTEAAAKRLLARYGVPVCRERVARTAAEAVDAADWAGYPVVMKVHSAALTHKSDVGGVRLGLADASAVASAFGELAELARAAADLGTSGPDTSSTGTPSTGTPEVLVQPLVRPGVELLLGGVRDRYFGPVVTVGLGGIHAEILAEHHSALAPLTREHARTLVRRLCQGRLAEHPRGLSAAGVDAAAGALFGIGQLMAGEPTVRELDVNPLIVTGGDAVAVDALVLTGARTGGGAGSSGRAPIPTAVPGVVT